MIAYYVTDQPVTLNQEILLAPNSFLFPQQGKRR